MTTLSVAEAAQVLGIGEQTVRRRIKRGTLKAVRVERPQGYEWQVTIDGALSHVSDHVEVVDVSPDQVTDQVDQVSLMARDQVHLVRVMESLVSQFEAERERSAALEREKAELYGRLGFLQAQLEGAKERLALLEAPKPPRRWWQFW